MSHLVKPTSFRAGKTQTWSSNALIGGRSLVNSDLLLSRGIYKLNKSLLRRKRIYLVKGSIAYKYNSKLNYNMLYAPKIKTKPREHSIGAFIRRSIYKPFNWDIETTSAKTYVDQRKEKIAKIKRRYKPKRLNKWLTRRMLRGAAPLVWKTPTIQAVPRIDRAVKLFQYQPEGVAKGSEQYLTVQGIFNKGYMLEESSLFKIHAKHRRYRSRRHRWQYDPVKRRRFNNKRFSALVGNMLGRNIKIKALNMFSYLLSKKVLNYKSHQNHFWNFAYRRYRFQYKNYYDIANSFLAMGLVDHTEGFLLSILRLTLPLILKIRRFFKFLNAIIKNMPELEDKFLVFKMHLAGKIAGGTKRTKAHSIGYGTLPVQTLDVIVSNNFLSYRHIYGEFGLKLVTCKNPKYKSPALLA